MKLLRRKTFLRMKDRLATIYGKEVSSDLANRLYHLIGRYGINAFFTLLSIFFRWRVFSERLPSNR